MESNDFYREFYNPSRPQKPSLKELVNRFDSKEDGTNSRPHTPGQRSVSNSPAPEPASARLPKYPGNARGYMNTRSVSSFSISETKRDTASMTHKRKLTGLNSTPAASTSQPPKVERSRTAVANNPWASHSMNSLHLSHNEAARRPLFGEVLGAEVDPIDPGFGIRDQRGGSGGYLVPSGSNTHQRSRSDVDVSPSSPTAWYLGLTSALDSTDVNGETLENPSSRRLHRRAKSDFAGRPPLVADTNGIGMHPSTSSSLQELRPRPLAKSKAKSSSRSRIPLSTRRRSTTSDSGISPQSSRSSSAMGGPTNARIVSQNGHSGIPRRRLTPPSPVQSSSATKATPRRRDLTLDQSLGPNASLKAYISAPLPEKSPPLRSSRPRLPVSSATTSSSRAKIAERYGTQQSNGPRRNEPGNKDNKARQRNIPELGGVDFAARREKIQRAFTKSVKERERNEKIKAEARKIIAEDKEKGTPQIEGLNLDELEIKTHDEHRRLVGTERVAPKSSLGRSDQAIISGDGIAESQDKQLPNIETDLFPSHDEEESTVADTFGEDSPTLGIPGSFPDSQVLDLPEDTPARILTPSSAVTATTHIENEPQAEERPSSQADSPKARRTILSQVMQMRDSSPTSTLRTEFMDDSESEKDDAESVQIMFRGTPVEKHAEDEDKALHVDAQNTPQSVGGWENWIMGTSAASVRTKDALDGELDSPMERIDENISPRQPASEAIESSPDKWFPGSFRTPKSGHSTLNSETYSTINRVLEHYHDPKLSSPEMLHGFQQHMLTQSPELARQGGWDTKRVTQLYLQELARGRYNDPKIGSLPKVVTSPADSLRDDQGQKEPRTVSSVTELESDESEDSRGEGDHTYELSESGWSSRGPSLDVEEKTRTTNRASLEVKNDWMDASPSVVDWIHPQSTDTPVEEKDIDYRPPPPPKDWNPSSKQAIKYAGSQDLSQQNLDREGAQTPRVSSGKHPELPEIRSAGEGLGLSIKMEPSEDSPTLIPPPLPNHSPPPPPISATTEKTVPTEGHARANVRSPPSPSVYPQSSMFPPETGPKRSSGDSSYYLGGSTVSPLPTQPTSISLSQEDVVQEQNEAAPNEIFEKSKGPSPEQRKLTFRKHLIKELLDTEKTFHTDMTVANEIYKGTSGACNGITADDVKVLFGNIDQIVAFSKEFLDTLKHAASSVYVITRARSESQSKRGSRSTSNSAVIDERFSVSGMELTDLEKDRKTFIGEAFGQHIVRMEKLYGDYLRNHEAANQRLEKLQKEPRVALWLAECRTVADDLTAAWSLDSLLVKPVQRILKYPLLLSQLLEATPENHPDFTALDIANREMTGASRRINEMKKRVDLVDQAVRRKRKESDVRVGISKAFGRRTEKLRQQVGLSEIVDDPEFNQISERWHHHYLQLQFTIRDVHYYQEQIQSTVDRFNDFAAAMESHLDVGQSNCPEMESKWRKFAMAVREISSVAINEHTKAITRSVTEPMSSLIKIYENPQKIIQKRNKRATEYARFKVIKERGDKPDKRTQEQSDQFMALNDTLKDELPKLYSLTSKLAEACLGVFVQLQVEWQTVWQEKIRAILDDHQIPRNAADINSQFSGDFAIIEGQALSLGICNGSLVAESVNFLSPQSTLGEGTSRRPPPGSRSRTRSLNSDASPTLPAPDFVGKRNSGNLSFSPLMESMPLPLTGSVPIQTHYANHSLALGRARTGSNLSSQGGIHTPESRSFSVSTSGGGAVSGPGSRETRPSTSTARSIESTQMPRKSTDSPSPSVHRPPSGSFNFSGLQPNPDTQVNERPYSGFFSSAMPMSENNSPWTSRPSSSPRELEPVNLAPPVLFVVASLYEFNIDRERREAGYPYLTYVKGEVFDVIAEKGELWLARNQDDQSGEVGWIWNKHFAKLNT
ncbi:MAG: hypothetical protein M1837_006554 [Sclerophora amabilis]|nr:MAG: hypothetical protein M1837_006554 [Sclerophora amabilis]